MFLNESQVAELLSVTSDAVRYWRRNGTGPSWYKFGRFIRYQKDEVVQWAESQVVKARSNS